MTKGTRSRARPRFHFAVPRKQLVRESPPLGAEFLAQGWGEAIKQHTACLRPWVDVLSSRVPKGSGRHLSSLLRSFWLKISWHLHVSVKKTATIWAMEEMVARREEMITLYEELVTVAVLMAITRGLALRPLERRSTAKAAVKAASRRR